MSRRQLTQVRELLARRRGLNAGINDDNSGDLVNRLRSIACALALLGSTLANAQGVDVIADLRAHRFDNIERQLQAVDAAFQSGQRVGEEDLLDAYKVFYVQQEAGRPVRRHGGLGARDAGLVHRPPGERHLSPQARRIAARPGFHRERARERPALHAGAVRSGQARTARGPAVESALVPGDPQPHEHRHVHGRRCARRRDARPGEMPPIRATC